MCTGLRVRRRQTDAAGNEVLVAEMSVGYKAIRESFTSRVTLDRPAQKILVEYIDGPFSHLENVWTFRDATEPSATEASTIDFAIDYEFRSRMLGILMGGLFDAAFRKFAEAFERRADIVYGPAARRTTAST
jgi:coenzyme Q-binding protein COQ10